MEKYSFHVGIDVSKLKLDVCILQIEKMGILKEFEILNNKSGIKRMIGVLKSLKISVEHTLFCFENTGIYSLPLSIFFSESGRDYWEVPALEIKKSKGITRGKKDKTDARDIAMYSVRNIDKFTPSSIPEVDIQKLALLFSEREKVVKSIKLFTSTMEGVSFIPNSILKAVSSENKKTTVFLKKSLKVIEAKILAIIKQNEVLNNQFKLLKSVPGIGNVTAQYMIISTRGFKKFTEWRKFACYSGIAPFEYSSGSSIRGKTRVNHLADKKMKSLLQMAAMAAVKHDAETKEYYARKVDEGKNKMLVYNNIRCKVVSRAFAVIKRSSPYVDVRKYAA